MSDEEKFGEPKRIPDKKIMSASYQVRIRFLSHKLSHERNGISVLEYWPLGMAVRALVFR
jgi:hypothetical protein